MKKLLLSLLIFISSLPVQSFEGLKSIKTSGVNPSRLKRTFQNEYDFVFILSRQRSGSTTLAADIADLFNPCSFMMNEMFNENSMDQHGILRNEALFRKFYFNLDEMSPLQYLLNQSNTFAQIRIENIDKELYKTQPSFEAKYSNMKLIDYCSNIVKLPFFGVVKIFDEPNWGQTDANSQMYEGFSELIGYERSLNIVLERNPAQQECSLKWAELTGDWGTNPSLHHVFGDKFVSAHESIEEFRKRCPNSASRTFEEKHLQWYNTLDSIHDKFKKSYIKVFFEIEQNESKKNKLFSLIKSAISPNTPTGPPPFNP